MWRQYDRNGYCWLGYNEYYVVMIKSDENPIFYY